METENQLHELAVELRQMASAVATNPTIPSADLRRVLRFLTKVLEVVDQSFQDVYGILIDIQFLTPVLVATGRVEQLQADLQEVFSRSRFRDAEEICSRLHHLGETYNQTIRPIVEPLHASQEWYQVFFLLNEHEGRIIRMIQDAVYELRSMLSSDLGGRKLSSLKCAAREKAEFLRQSLSELQDLRNRILGFSGRIGFLELTEVDRNQLQREITIMMGDTNINYGKAGIVGSGKARDITQNDWNMHKESIDLSALAQELATLRAAMRKTAPRWLPAHAARPVKSA
jgi:hypothetical protein